MAVTLDKRPRLTFKENLHACYDTCCTCRERAAFEHYVAVRRDGSIVPFEPSRIVEAMKKAFLVVLATQTNKNHNGLMMSRTGHSSMWLKKVWRLVLHLKHAMQAMLVGERHHAQSSGANRPLDGGKKQGFFSASKPNLHNAP